jgi:hypothetical protein
VYLYIYIYCCRFFIKTVAIFPATYTLQQLDKSLQNKQNNETTSYRIPLVTYSPTSPQSLPCSNMPAHGTHHLCLPILSTRHILTYINTVAGVTRLLISDIYKYCVSRYIFMKNLVAEHFYAARVLRPIALKHPIP